MMLYAVERTDGELEIIRLVPQFVVLVSEKKKLRVSRVVRLATGWRWICGDVVLDIPFSLVNEFGDCEPDTLLASKGLMIEFPTPAEITKQRPELTRAMWTKITTADIPKERDFRAAWKKNGKGVVVDMPKAREIHRDTLRKMRVPLMVQLDTDWFIANGGPGGPAAKAIINGKKQALRDVTDDPMIEAATTPEELKAAIPPILLA